MDRIWQIEGFIYDIGESLAELARTLTDIEACTDSRTCRPRPRCTNLRVIVNPIP